MKKYLLILLLGTSVAGVFGQSSLQITTPHQVVYGANSLLMHSSATITNNSLLGPIDVRVERTVNDTAPHHSSYFCWGTNCYDTATSVSFNTETIDDSGSTNTSFIAYLQPNGYDDTSYVTYCFYDDNNQSDSVCMTFTYISNPTGIEEYLTSNNSVTNAYPNPANNFTKVAYNLTSLNEAKLVVYNVLGSVVREIKLTSRQNVVSIPTADLRNGIYIYSLINNGDIIATKRLIVDHR